MASKKGSSQQQTQQCEGCGYDPSNKRHELSYWEGLTDPRGYPDSYMKFNSVYYKMIDRQIAEDHATECLPQGQAGGTSGAGTSGAGSSGASGGHQKKN